MDERGAAEPESAQPSDAGSQRLEIADACTSVPSGTSASGAVTHPSASVGTADRSSVSSQRNEVAGHDETIAQTESLADEETPLLTTGDCLADFVCSCCFPTLNLIEWSVVCIGRACLDSSHANGD